MRIVLTQARGRLEGLADALRARGHEVTAAPLIGTRTLTGEATRRAAEALLGLPWRCYVSRSAVESWAELGLPFEDGARLAAVGAGTAAALIARGARVPPLTPAARSSSAAGLAEALLAAGAADHDVGLVQGSRARRELADRLRSAGARPQSAVVYEVIALPWQVEGHVDAVVLASPSAVAGLPRSIGERARLVALGPTTAAALEQHGWRCLEAPEPSVEGVLEALNAPMVTAVALIQEDIR